MNYVRQRVAKDMTCAGELLRAWIVGVVALWCVWNLTQWASVVSLNWLCRSLDSTCLPERLFCAAEGASTHASQNRACTGPGAAVHNDFHLTALFVLRTVEYFGDTAIVVFDCMESAPGRREPSSLTIWCQRSTRSFSPGEWRYWTFS